MNRHIFYYEIPKEPTTGRWEVDLFQKFFDRIKSLVDYPCDKVAIFAGKYICDALSSLEEFKSKEDYINDGVISYIGNIEKFHIYRCNTFSSYMTANIDDVFYIDFIGIETSSLFLK